MFNLKDMADMGKLASQAKQMQREQDEKHNDQISILKRMTSTLDEILLELRKNK